MNTNQCLCTKCLCWSQIPKHTHTYTHKLQLSWLSCWMLLFMPAEEVLSCTMQSVTSAFVRQRSMPCPMPYLQTHLSVFYFLSLQPPDFSWTVWLYQVLGYADYAFTSIFTVEILLKVPINLCFVFMFTVYILKYKINS